MAYKMTSSRPMPVVGHNERRAMGDSSNYEEIAVIGNGELSIVNLIGFCRRIFFFSLSIGYESPKAHNAATGSFSEW